MQRLMLKSTIGESCSRKAAMQSIISTFALFHPHKLVHQFELHYLNRKMQIRCLLSGHRKIKARSYKFVCFQNIDLVLFQDYSYFQVKREVCVV